MAPAALQALAAVLASFAALMAGLYAIVTRPLLGRLDRIEAELRDIRTELKAHGERLARVEERLPPPLVHR